MSNKNTSPAPTKHIEPSKSYQAPTKVPQPPIPSGIYADPIKLKHERKDSFDEVIVFYRKNTTKNRDRDRNI